jgi:thymidylate kinase
MIICFTGIDGSGKTLQARRLVERLNAAGRPARYVWTGGRAYLSRPLIWLAKRLLRAPRLGGTSQQEKHAQQAGSAAQYDSYLSSTRRLFRNRWLAAIWRQITLIEHTGEILAVALPHLLRGRIVVCDRYIYDSLIGTAVLAGTTPDQLFAQLPQARRYPVPAPALWFLIDLPAQTAFDRRTDVVDVAFLERRVPLYRAAALGLGARVIDGDRTPEAIADDVWGLVEPLLAREEARNPSLPA